MLQTAATVKPAPQRQPRYPVPNRPPATAAIQLMARTRRRKPSSISALRLPHDPDDLANRCRQTQDGPGGR